MNKQFFMTANDELKGYDILKRDSIKTEDGYEDEVILTVYSVEYIENILDTLNRTDAEG